MGQTSYYHYDGLGSTQLLTDENANVTDRYCNTAFGLPVSTGEANPTPNPFQFMGQQGYYLNHDTGSYYVRARTLSSVLARWLSEDPIGFSGGINLYTYAGSNPISGADASGLASVTLPFGCTMLTGEVRWLWCGPDFTIAVVGGNCRCSDPTMGKAKVGLPMGACMEPSCFAALTAAILVGGGRAAIRNNFPDAMTTALENCVTTSLGLTGFGAANLTCTCTI
jgi:RHS repeat-associated protein